MPETINFDALPDTALVRANDLVRHRNHPGRPVILPFAPSTFWRMVGEGRFPRPTKIGGRITCWRAGDVRAWLKRQADQASDDAQPAAPVPEQKVEQAAAPKACRKSTGKGQPRTSAIILKALREGKKTPAQLEALGIARAAARILDLRNRGYQIDSQKTGKTVVYTLVSEPKGASDEA